MLSLVHAAVRCWNLHIEGATIKRLEAPKLWLHRSMIKVSWSEHATNEQVMNIPLMKEQ